MSIHVPWLADAARLTGYPVVEAGGWRGRGHGGMRVVEGVVGHHTAGGPAGDYPSLRIVRDGRAGLAGPLSQLGLGRTGTVYVIAAGMTYHAGASAWAGHLDLNDEFLSIEAESVGTRDDWTRQQRDCYPRLVAALLYFMRRGSDRFAGHREICRPAGRKIDPAFWDLGAFRARVGWLLGDPLRRIPRLAMEDDMFTDPDRDLLRKAARQQDVGFALDVILERLVPGVPREKRRDPVTDAEAGMARRQDVRYVLDQVLGQILTEIRTVLPGVIAAEIRAALAQAGRTTGTTPKEPTASSPASPARSPDGAGA